MKFNISKTCQIDHNFYNSLLVNNFNNSGFFVDVGCNDGLECSNTSCLIDAKWSGIMIDPEPNAYQQCANLYKNNNKIKVINCGISNQNEILELNCCGALSTFCNSGINFNRIGRKPKKQIQCYTLNYILEQNNIKKIDLISIDTEGFEDKVLDGFDIDKYQPKILIIELHAGKRPDNGMLSEFRNNILIQNCKIKLENYNLVYNDHINDIYIRK